MKRLTIAGLMTLCLASLVLIAADPPQKATPDNRATLDAARGVVQELENTGRIGDARVFGQDYYMWSTWLAEVQRDGASDRAGKQAALAAHADRMKALEAKVLTLRRANEVSDVAVFAAAFYRAKADKWLKLGE